MKKISAFLLTAILLAGVFSSCSKNSPSDVSTAPSATASTTQPADTISGVRIGLSDSGITVDGSAASADASQDIYVANDIVYYESGHDFTYGEGTQADSHSKEEAAAHTVIHITKPGSYILSGKLSKGQVAVDLGENAEEDPSAVVTLILNNADISCSVAPAVIFYNVYECGSKDTETASAAVDTSAAGANVLLADNSVNNINGSYVARIYKPDSVVLSSDGTEVEDAKKLHKYDAAFYSKMSMNVNGNGTLNINAANEGLDSELHLTLNGGNINIVSGNDGINTNEDYVSVTTVNGGNLNIIVSGETGEGDGIDSNGWLVINGGSVSAQACSLSGDAGIDSDMGIQINGGKVFATGNMLDRISESKQTFAVFSFNGKQNQGTYTLKNSQNNIIAEKEITNSFSYLIISDPSLAQGDYTLWNNGTQLQGASSGMGAGRPGGMPQGDFPADIPEGMPEDMSRPEMPEDMSRPQIPEGEMPPMPEGMTMPEGMSVPDMPDDGRFGGMNGNPQGENFGELSDVFTIKNGENYFSSVKPVEQI